MDKLKKVQFAEEAAYNEAAKELKDELDKQKPDVNRLSSLLAHFEQVNEDFIRANQNVLKKMLETKVADDVYAAEVLKEKNFRRDMRLLIDQVNRKLPKDDFDDNGSVSGSVTGWGDSLAGCKLPKWQLPSFSGKLKDWMPFWSQFLKVHENKKLEDSDRLAYLFQCMEKDSEPYEIVSSYPLTSENYNHVVAALKERYGREDLQVRIHVHELIDLVSLKNRPEDANNMSSLYVKLTGKLRALENLSVTKDKCAALLYPLVEKCLPNEPMKMWERHRSQLRITNSEDELEYLIKFLQNEVRAEDNMKLANSGIEESAGRSKKDKGKKEIQHGVPAAAALLAGPSPDKEKKKPACAFCEKNHATSECGSASKLTKSEKQDIIKTKRLCFNCLKPGHNSSKCKSFVKCVVCGEKHLAVMCQVNATHSQGNQPTGNDATMCQVENPEVLLQTMIVFVHGPNEKRRIRAIVDSGSQKSYLLKSVAESMNLKKVSEESTVHTLFGGRESDKVTHGRYSATFSDVDEKFRCEFLVSDMPVIANNILKISKGPWMNELRQHQVKLTDCGEGVAAVDALFGADVAGRLLTGRKIELSTGPVAVETKLGWTLMGKLPVEKKRNKDNSFMVTNLQVSDASIQELWSLDAIGIQDADVNQSRKELEESAICHFEESVVQLEDGRYEVHLPWIERHQPLTNNKNMAIQRLKATTQKLQKDGMLEAYHEIFRDWEKQKIIERVNQSTLDATDCFYFPHRPVYKPSSTSTPIRPVFDASARVKGSPSLNMCLEKGPNLLEMIPDIMTRFRMKRYGVIADIRKAFLQMSVAEKDRDYLRFLWYDSPQSMKMIEYRHCRVVFGVTSSPFLLAATLNHHLDHAGEDDKEIAMFLRKSFYVDNIATSINSKEECLEFQQKASALLSKGKFELRGWEFGFQSSEDSVPLLGMLWTPEKDKIMCDLKGVLSSDWSKCTKRNILSAAHKIYDPLGLLSPFIVHAKMILQKTWELKMGWDEELPANIQDEFSKWVEQIGELAEYQVPRWLTPNSENEDNLSLHVFVDASQDAYATVIYLRNESKDGITVNIVQARARVTPKKKVTIPRLELVSCLIGARLADSVMKAMGLEVPVWYWSDSTVAIAWIQREETWNMFVNNRVTEIRKLTNPESWNHVPGELNPADLPSRGASAKKLLETRWWEGPEWLRLPEKEWPNKAEEIDEEVVSTEKKKSVVSCHAARSKSSTMSYIERYSDYEKMLRGIAWIGRFITYFCKKPVRRDDLIVKELEKAEKLLIYYIQKEAFTGIEDRAIIHLQPYEDEDKLIRIKTKILSLEEEELFKTPYLMPSRHEVVLKLIRWYHEKNQHAGVQTLQLLLREKFWIIRSRQLIKKVVKSCLDCARHSSKRLECLPPPLPKERIQQCRPFEVVGVDLAGPLFLKTGEKVWIVLYTCAVYRAVHLELTTTLSTDGFIQTLRRFCGRRGRPGVIYSDNGTNFRGAHNIFRKVNWESVQKYAGVSRIQWKFNPATAAWWGGFWERMVGVVKGVLKRILGKASLNYDELMTIMIETEAIINRRPLTYVSEDNEDLTPLTPSMYLENAPCTALPEADETEHKTLNKRFKYRQEIRQQLQKRFRQEYLSQLIHHGNVKGSKSVKVGDIVLVGQDNMKRLDWPMGKIIEILKSCDGMIRTVKVKTKMGIIVRPIQRLYPLEVSLEEAQKEKIVDDSNTSKEEIKTRFGRVIKPPNRLCLLLDSLNVEY